MPIYTTPPSEEDIHRMAEAALRTIPVRLSQHIQGVAIMVEDLADAETLADLGIDNPWELTGLYHGSPLTERSVSDPVPFPQTIHLYREAILIEWIETGEDLNRLVASVLVHEVAHHFGISDPRLEELGWA